MVTFSSETCQGQVLRQASGTSSDLTGVEADDLSLATACVILNLLETDFTQSSSTSTGSLITMESASYSYVRARARMVLAVIDAHATSIPHKCGSYK